MYTEENQRGRFPLRDILLKAIVIIIFLILIIFIVTKVTRPNNTIKSSSDYDKVFSENLEAMENAAYTYYTTDRLPKEVGELNELTLREMINSNLLNAFTDADGNACDVNSSYIRLTKNDNDYTLRVNLECDDAKDYTLTKVGEYDYCEHDICKRDSSKEKNVEENNEKQEDTKEVEITEPTDTTVRSSTGTINSGSTNNATSSGGNSSSNGSSNNTPQVTTMYEYRKVTSPVLSGWSSWSSWIHNNERYSAVKCGSNDANCLREVQLYSRREYIGTIDGKPAYATVNYYSYRTRTLISSGSTDAKWSTYNDINLLNQGYTYTGNIR